MNHPDALVGDITSLSHKLKRLDTAILRRYSQIQSLRQIHRQKTRRLTRRLHDLWKHRKHYRCAVQVAIETRRSQQHPPPPSPADPATILPFELLTEVFLYAAAGEGSSAYDELEVAQSTPWLLSYVSSLWRQVAISSPGLWSNLVVDESDDKLAHWTEGRLELLDVFLERSKAHPLHVTHMAGFDTEIFFQSLQPRASQIYSLELSMLESAENALALHELASTELSALHTLCLTVEGPLSHSSRRLQDNRTFPPTPPTGRLFKHSKHLSEVSLYGVSLSAFPLPLEQVTTYHGDVVTSEDFILLFETATKLRCANLTLYARVVHDRDMIYHSSLERLSILSDYNCFQYIRLPKLRSFLVQTRFPMEERHRWDRFLCDSPELETLAIDIHDIDGACSDDILWTVEGCTSVLTTLSVRVTSRQSEYLYNALNYDGVSCAAPNLLKLYICDETYTYPADIIRREIQVTAFSENRLVPMVLSRTRAVEGGVERLRSLALNAPYSYTSESLKKTFQELLDLRKEGLDVVIHQGYNRTMVMDDNYGLQWI